MSFNFTDVSNRRSQDEHYSALSKYVTNNAVSYIFVEPPTEVYEIPDPNLIQI